MSFWYCSKTCYSIDQKAWFLAASLYLQLMPGTHIILVLRQNMVKLVLVSSSGLDPGHISRPCASQLPMDSSRLALSIFSQASQHVCMWHARKQTQMRSEQSCTVCKGLVADEVHAQVFFALPPLQPLGPKPTQGTGQQQPVDQFVSSTLHVLGRFSIIQNRPCHAFNLSQHQVN